MKYLITRALIVCFFVAAASFASAQSDETFVVRVFGGVDANPPTTPTLLSVIPVASTQIDITWSAATDDTMLSGYSVLRDGVPIATTTLLSYSDSGLVASTTYSYVVRAFDPSFNYSSTSNALATTTPNPPVVPPVATTTEPVSGQSGTAARVIAEAIAIDVGMSTTSLLVTTAHQARLEVRWGRTGSYELGYVVSSVFAMDHTVLLTDLEPGTEYEYEIVGYTPFGVATVIKQGSFTTVKDEGQYAVSNVEQFSAIAVDTNVLLSWKLPSQPDLVHVRIVRSHLGFPEHPQDGAIVYQGIKESATDERVLNQYSPVYYTAFVYDQFGNISSGAVAVVYAATVFPGAGFEQTGPGQGPIIGVPVPDTNDATSSIDTKRFTVEMKMPLLSEVLVAQGNLTYLFTDAPIQLDAATAFTVSVPRTAVAGNLKSLIATIQNPVDPEKTYSFLLRINRDRTAYEAQIPALFIVGQSLLILEIYDYEAFVVGTYQTPVIFIETIDETKTPVIFPDLLFAWWPSVALVLGVLLVLLILFLLHKRRTEDNA
ncbi:fibronectin type III domain-containing protein [Candidatus Kaiserbacteria bacterium]|nr:fibronectin type III domain-containing protein [Candidatus Kaiserbacteria bacterium]